MPVIKSEDARAFQIDEEIVCAACIEDEERGEVTADDIITSKKVDGSEDLWFCDRCKKRI
jgi:hypothetical protein